MLNMRAVSRSDIGPISLPSIDACDLLVLPGTDRDAGDDEGAIGPGSEPGSAI